MDLKTLRAELQKLAALAEGWDASHEIADIERDLALGKLRELYDAVRFGLDSAVQPSVEDELSSVDLPQSGARHDPMHRRNKGTGSPGCRGVCYRCSGGTCADRKALQHPPIPFLMEYSKNLYKRKLLLLTGYSTRLKTLNILPP